MPKDKQKQKQQEKKKKKQPCELRSDPPIRRTLGSRRVSLEALLATEDLVATVCDFGILITEQPLQPLSLEEKVVRSMSWGRAVGTGCWGGVSAHPALLIRPSVPSPKNGAEIALLERHPPLLALLFEIGIISKCCYFLWAYGKKIGEFILISKNVKATPHASIDPLSLSMATCTSCPDTLCFLESLLFSGQPLCCAPASCHHVLWPVKSWCQPRR